MLCTHLNRDDMLMRSGIASTQSLLTVAWDPACRRLLVLTGAGCSTESNLPDYRSPAGAYSRGFKPMTHQLFMSGPAAQSRYWHACSPPALPPLLALIWLGRHVIGIVVIDCECAHVLIFIFLFYFKNIQKIIKRGGAH